MVRNSGAQVMVVLDFFEGPFWMFEKFGVCLYRTSSKERLSLKEAISFAISMVQIGAYSILVPLFFIKTTPPTTAEFSDACIPLILFFTSIVRLTSILVNPKRIRTLVDIFQKYFPQNMEEQKNFKVERNYKELIRVTKALAICLSLGCVLFSLAPLFNFAMAYYTIDDEAKFDYRMPYPIWYPFKVNTPGMYAIMCSTQAFAAFSCVCAYFLPNMVLITSMLLINMNFKYLAKTVRNLTPTNTDDDMKNLSKILSHHQDIFLLVDVTNEIFNISVFISFFSSIALLCSIGMNVLGESQPYHIIKQSLLLVSSLCDLYYTCKYADDMKTSSLDMSDALAEHPWYDGSVYYQRMLLFPMARAQRPAQLMAYKFFAVSMESFQSVLTNSYQLLTLVKARFDVE
uniref:Odorant receptor n=1 Tax=Glossina morsitans morsitans TaxID=37546 RepID=A0ABK9NEW3_GLOMM